MKTVRPIAVFLISSVIVIVFTATLLAKVPSGLVSSSACFQAESTLGSWTLPVPVDGEFHAIVETQITRSTDGPLTVRGQFVGVALVDGFMTITISPSPWGAEDRVTPEVSLNLGYGHAPSVIEGSAWVPAGTYAVTLMAATGAPDALIYAGPGTRVTATPW